MFVILVLNAENLSSKEIFFKAIYLNCNSHKALPWLKKFIHFRRRRRRLRTLDPNKKKILNT